MKKMFVIKIVLVFALVFSAFLSTNASSASSAVEESSSLLVRLQLIEGDGDGNLRLEDMIERCEFFTLFLRITGYDRDTGLDSVDMPFKDITPDHWAYNNIKAAYKHGLVYGYPDNTVLPDGYITFTEALALTLRVLGYNISFGSDEMFAKANELSLTKNLDLSADRQITRGEMAILVYNSLSVSFYR